MKIFVAGLPYDLDDAELMEIFEKFGDPHKKKVRKIFEFLQNRIEETLEIS